MIDEKQNLSLQLDLEWQDDLAHYCDRFFLLKTNFWRDSYPAVLDYQIRRAELGQVIKVNYKPGDLLLDEFSQSNFKTIPLTKFDQYFKGAMPITPMVGRFYPRGMIEGVAGCFKMDDRPFRVIAKTEDTLDIDLNHPLAAFPLHLTATITDIFEANQQNGGRCNEVAEVITIHGPGFQCLLKSQSTEFFQRMPFSRRIEDDDGVFYNAVDSKPPVDQVAIEQLKLFFSQHLKDNSKILDLMAAPDSYLPEQFTSLDVTGLGVKELDMQQNSILNHRVVHDLNRKPELPFKDQEFDTIICSFAIEYMTQPEKVFLELSRILKPGGKVIITFSEHYYQKKVIALWEDVHPFERMGVVLEYFRQSGEFENLRSESIRGLIKNDDDPFISKNVYSCPLFIISGEKI